MDEKGFSKGQIFYPSYRKYDCPAQKENDPGYSQSDLEAIQKIKEKLMKESSQDALEETYERDPDTWSAEGIPVDVPSLILQNDNYFDVSGESSVSAIDYEMLKETDLGTSKIRDCRVTQNTSENMSQSLYYKPSHQVSVNHTLNSVSASDSVAGPSGISYKRSRSSVCGKEFAENEDLRIHSTSISASDFVAGPSEISSKHSRSSVCGREFSENEDPQIYSLSHTVEKPFHCKSCEKRYASKRGLDLHLQIYTTKKPYVCGECRVEFALLCGLDKHLLSHSGVYHLQCDLCEHWFLNLRALMTHRHSHLAEDE
ncbi:PR domain zinc finger protein 5 [Araneus ventricosus]|uniref:PR domain zinc finger protein 5 n=1 Tax=Araneus ventricosus TaxID=182803 RepID=A0A4Y2J161_ARAVE|nr:PR domain zinc finger protein 5 [Araneus ventricosus]